MPSPRCVVQIRITDRQRERWFRVARELGISLSDLIRQELTRFEHCQFAKRVLAQSANDRQPNP